MFPVATVTSPNSHGGSALTGEKKILVNGLPIHRMTDQTSCPIPFHGPITSQCKGAKGFMIGGLMVARVGDDVCCGAKISQGSLNMMVGNGGG